MTEIWPSDAEISASVASSISPRCLENVMLISCKNHVGILLRVLLHHYTLGKKILHMFVYHRFLKEFNQVLLQSNQ